MKYVDLGRTGVRVSELCMGTMTFGAQADEEMSGKLFQRCLDAGINHFDCADIYGLVKYTRSNQNTCINQRPLVMPGDKIAGRRVIPPLARIQRTGNAQRGRIKIVSRKFKNISTAINL